MTVDASRSCLCLAACIGSAIRQIVDTRVLLTLTVPPALPGRSMSNSVLAPPLMTVTRLPRSAFGHCRMAGDGPDEPRQLAGNRGSDDAGRFAGSGESTTHLAFPRDVADRLRLVLLAQQH